MSKARFVMSRAFQLVENFWCGNAQGSLYDSPRAGFAGCSHAQRLRALVTRELSAKLTEGEKML